jgi:hypothetical protein
MLERGQRYECNIKKSIGRNVRCRLEAWLENGWKILVWTRDSTVKYGKDQKRIAKYITVSSF